MTVRIGDAGGIGLAKETTYGTAATTPIWQHPVSSSLGLRKSLIQPAILGTDPYSVRYYAVPFGDGETSIAWDDSRAVVGDLLASIGNLATDVYTIGDGSAPDETSLTMWIDTGGHLMRYTGFMPDMIRWEFQPNKEIVCSFGGLAKAGTSETPVAISAPAESGIVYETALSTITIGGTAFCVLSATMEASVPLVGSDRHCLGSSTIKQPERVGRSVCTATLNVELADTTGADSEAELDDYLAGTAVGDVVLGDFEISSCYMTGDVPALSEGITQFPINVVGTQLEITTTA